MEDVRAQEYEDLVGYVPRRGKGPSRGDAAFFLEFHPTLVERQSLWFHPIDVQLGLRQDRVPARPPFYMLLLRHLERCEVGFDLTYMDGGRVVRLVLPGQLRRRHRTNGELGGGSSEPTGCLRCTCSAAGLAAVQHAEECTSLLVPRRGQREAESIVACKGAKLIP